MSLVRPGPKGCFVWKQLRKHCAIASRVTDKGDMSGRLRGDGQIFKRSKFVAHAHFEVQVTSNYKRTRNLGGMLRVFLGRDIKLRITPNEDIAKHVGAILTLHFEDSRRLDFILTSSSGDCVASGDFYTSGRSLGIGTPRKHRSLLSFGLS